MADSKSTQRSLFEQETPASKTGRPSHRLTREQKDSIPAAYQAGETLEAIGARLGIMASGVFRYLQLAGVKCRSNRKDITGQTFGQLTVIRHLADAKCLCRCSCGTEEVADSTALRKGRHVRCVKCRLPEEMAETKKCSKCKRVLPWTAEYFTRNCQHRFGVRARCKECTRPETNEDSLRNRLALKREVLAHYSGSNEPFCACCGEKTLEFLNLDHLEGSSREDYKKYHTTCNFFYHIKREGYKLKAQVACANCNNSLGHRGYCPHHPEITRPIRSMTLKQKISPSVLARHEGDWKTCVCCFMNLPLTPDFFSQDKSLATGFKKTCRACVLSDSARSKKKNNTIRLRVLNHYSNGKMECECCRTKFTEFLTLDHIDDNGRQHREKVKEPMYRYLYKNKFPNDFRLRVLCIGCNQARSWFGVCPHQKEKAEEFSSADLT